MTLEPERLDIARCANMLGVTLWQVRRAVKRGYFAEPAGSDTQGRPYWHIDGVYEWAARAEAIPPDRIPLKYWPKATEAASYLGARPIGNSAIALGWRTVSGPLWVAWDHPGDKDATLMQGVEALPDAAAITAIGGDFGRDGPAVWAILPGTPDREHYEIRWSRLSEIVGEPVPFWPFTLRIPELLKAWRPGSTPTVAAAIPILDISPPLCLAAAVEQGSPAQQTLLNLAQVWQSRATRDAEQELEILGKIAKPGTTVVAATPLKVPDVELDDLDESVRRAGWLEILAREDNLAALCVREKVMWDGGSGFPSSNPEPVDTDSEWGKEWVRRLVPVSRTAAVELLDPRQSATELLIDPETDALAVRDDTGRVHAAIPQRLPATSQLAELILDAPIWVRTQDGTLYPAPKHHYYGLSWGYCGSGPGALALLAYRLLSDINAPAADSISGAPEGLENFMEEKWPKGTVLRRAQLEAARDGKPYTKPR